MALSDLSNVTRTVIELLRQSFIASDDWQTAAPLVMPEPPSRITKNGIGFYLYHIKENAAYKNLPAQANVPNHIRFSSLALNLYYQLSANSTIGSEGDGAYGEQNLMGFAMKFLHDFPEITDQTIVNGVRVMPLGIRGRDNRFKISMHPIPPAEAIQYWEAGTSPVKLSAYYELTVVLLEPETIQRRAGRVLAYGIHTFVQGAPQLTNSQNTLTFSIPREAQARRIKIQPAQAPPNNANVANAPNSIAFWGTGLKGDVVELLLHGSWASWNNQPAKADASWNLEAKEHTLTIEVQETALLDSGNAVVVLPGLYGAQVRVKRRRLMPDGQTREFVHLSNQCPITITPRIDGITPPVGNVIYYAVNGFTWSHPDLTSTLIQVYLGPEQLNSGDPANLGFGEFGAQSSTELRFRLPAAPIFQSGQFVPLRIFVNGAESPPEWIQIP